MSIFAASKSQFSASIRRASLSVSDAAFPAANRAFFARIRHSAARFGSGVTVMSSVNSYTQSGSVVLHTLQMIFGVLLNTPSPPRVNPSERDSNLAGPRTPPLGSLPSSQNAEPFWPHVGQRSGASNCSVVST